MGWCTVAFLPSATTTFSAVSPPVAASHRPSFGITTTSRPRTPSQVPCSIVDETAEGEVVQEEPPKLSAVRRLILLRHAESSWGDRSLRDHDRPLSKAGREDAAAISSKLQKMGWVPELILSSDATRTKETLQIMQENVQDFLEAEVLYIASFYSISAMDGQTAEHLRQAICKHSRDDILTIMCMGHNRGWEEAASMFSGVSVELKTCNAALLEAEGKSWDEAFVSAGLGGWKLHLVVKPNGLA